MKLHMTGSAAAGHHPHHHHRPGRRTADGIRMFLLLLLGAVITFFFISMKNVHSSATPHPAVKKGDDASPDVPTSPLSLDTKTSPVPTHQKKGTGATTVVAARPYRIACIGDSITYGNGTHIRRGGKERDGEGSYPLELQKLLNSRLSSSGTSHDGNCSKLRTVLQSGSGDRQTPVQVRNFGRSGRTVTAAEKKYSYRHTKEFNASLVWDPDLIIVLLGTNDSKNRHWKGRDRFIEEYLSLLKLYEENFVEQRRRKKLVRRWGYSNFDGSSDYLRVVLVEPPPVYVSSALPPEAFERLRDRSSKVAARTRPKQTAMMIDPGIVQQQVVPAVGLVSHHLMAAPTSKPVPPSLPPRSVKRSSEESTSEDGGFVTVASTAPTRSPSSDHQTSDSVLPQLLFPGEPVPLYTAFQTALKGFTNWKLHKSGGLISDLLHDGVHPSVAGHQLIAKQVFHYLCD